MKSSSKIKGNKILKLVAKLSRRLYSPQSTREIKPKGQYNTAEAEIIFNKLYNLELLNNAEKTC